MSGSCKCVACLWLPAPPPGKSVSEERGGGSTEVLPVPGVDRLWELKNSPVRVGGEGYKNSTSPGALESGCGFPVSGLC